MSTESQPDRRSLPGEPTWEAVTLLPNQGQWTEHDFFRLHTKRMAELVNGNLEVLPVPTWLHQLIVRLFLKKMQAWVESHDHGGEVLFAPLPVRLFPGTIREPDVMYVAPQNLPAAGESYPTSIDVVVEVVSAGTEARQRDYQDKAADYARAGVTEYWIVDPFEKQITVLGLEEGASHYVAIGAFTVGQTATSRYFKGFAVAVQEVFAVGDQDR